MEKTQRAHCSAMGAEEGGGSSAWMQRSTDMYYRTYWNDLQAFILKG